MKIALVVMLIGKKGVISHFKKKNRAVMMCKSFKLKVYEFHFLQSSYKLVTLTDTVNNLLSVMNSYWTLSKTLGKQTKPDNSTTHIKLSVVPLCWRTSYMVCRVTKETNMFLEPTLEVIIEV